MERWILLAGVIVVAVAGIALLVIAARRWLRDDPRMSQLRTIVYGGAGLLLLIVGGAVAYKFKISLASLFQSDFTADPHLLEELQNARLSLPPDRKPDAVDYWPQWRGPYRDGISDEKGLNLDWNTKAPAVVWRQKIGGGYSSIAVVGDRLYTMDKEKDTERILCLDTATGETKWHFDYEVDYGPVAYGEGPRATPTIHDGRLYSVGATGIFLCLELPNAESAQPKELWRIDLMKAFDVRPPSNWWGMACSPLIVDDMVIVQPGGLKGSIVAFDLDKGKLQWWSASDPSGYSSPVAATIAGKFQVVGLTGKRLIGLDPADGAELWKFDWTTEYDCNVATPIVVSDYIFISSDYDAGCATVKIEAAGNGFKVVPIFKHRKDHVMRNHFSTCVFHKDHLFGCDTVGHGSDRCTLRCIDFRTNSVKWSQEFEKCSMLLVDGHLIVLGQDGKLTVVEATADGYRAKGELKALNGRPAWSPPALAAGRLYLRNNKMKPEIVCVDLRK